MARSGVEIIRLLPHSLGEWMLCPGFAVSDEPGFLLYSSLLHALDDGDVPHEVSEQYVLCYFRFSTPQPAEFDDAFTETARP